MFTLDKTIKNIAIIAAHIRREQSLVGLRVTKDPKNKTIFTSHRLSFYHRIFIYLATFIWSLFTDREYHEKLNLAISELEADLKLHFDTLIQPSNKMIDLSVLEKHLHIISQHTHIQFNDFFNSLIKYRESCISLLQRVMRGYQDRKHLGCPKAQEMIIGSREPKDIKIIPFSVTRKTTNTENDKRILLTSSIGGNAYGRVIKARREGINIIENSFFYIDGCYTKGHGKNTKGIGYQLMKDAVKTSIKEGCEGRIKLDAVRTAHGFWYKMGFRVPYNSAMNLRIKNERMNPNLKDDFGALLMTLHPDAIKIWKDIIATPASKQTEIEQLKKLLVEVDSDLDFRRFKNQSGSYYT